jgi:hypothetical protein
MATTGPTTERGDVPGDDSKQPSAAGGRGGPGVDFADRPEQVARAAGEDESRRPAG